MPCCTTPYLDEALGREEREGEQRERAVPRPVRVHAQTQLHPRLHKCSLQLRVILRASESEREE